MLFANSHEYYFALKQTFSWNSNDGFFYLMVSRHTSQYFWFAGVLCIQEISPLQKKAL